MYLYGQGPHWSKWSKNSCVCIRWEPRHGSLLRPVLQQEVQFKGDGEGLHLTESEWAFFPRQFSRAAFPGTAHFLMPHAHYMSTHVCECTGIYTYCTYAATLSCCVPGDTPYQTGIMSETRAGPERTTAPDGHTPCWANTTKKSFPLFKLASIPCNVLCHRCIFHLSF